MAATAPRWGKTYKEYLWECFRTGKLDPTKTSQSNEDMNYMHSKTSEQEHKILHKFLPPPLGNQRDWGKFNSHYRTAACEYFVSLTLRGQRACKFVLFVFLSGVHVA
jgi:hypothetical protein